MPKQYLELQPKTARLRTTEGQFSLVLILDEALVFRFPRSPHVASELAHEIPLLQALQGKLPLPIPNPIYSAYQAESGELLFMAYPMIQGDDLKRDVFESIQEEPVIETLARELAEFLKTLHSLKPANSKAIEKDNRKF